jgi:hypothetical protein
MFADSDVEDRECIQIDPNAKHGSSNVLGGTNRA